MTRLPAPAPTWRPPLLLHVCTGRGRRGPTQRGGGVVAGGGDAGAGAGASQRWREERVKPSGNFQAFTSSWIPAATLEP